MNCVNCGKKAEWTTPNGPLCGLCLRVKKIEVEVCNWIKGAEEKGFKEVADRDAKSEWMHNYYEQRKAKGLCVRCGKAAIQGRTCCAKHARVDRLRDRARKNRRAVTA